MTSCGVTSRRAISHYVATTFSEGPWVPEGVESSLREHVMFIFHLRTNSSARKWRLQALKAVATRFPTIGH